MLSQLKENFINPLDEFTPIPFWFWNDELRKEEIKRQIHDFKRKGVMGFVIHPRIGIPKHIEYLSDSFMELVEFAVKEAAGLNMQVVLYDEAMYPSGSAHGMVVKDNPEYASRGLKMIEHTVSGAGSITAGIKDGENIVTVLMANKTKDNCVDKESIEKLKFSNGQIDYDTEEGSVKSILIFIETFSKGTIRGIHFGEDDGQADAPPSGDLLNKCAMEKFISLTHDRYYSVLKPYFGNTVIAMFTDEPAIMGRCNSRSLRPWTGGFLDWYTSFGNKEEDLALLWLDGGVETEKIRKDYWKAVNKKLEETYYKPISKWCQEHGIALTGHPEKSDEIGFLKHFQIPGQDVVWRFIAPEGGKGISGQHSTMGKCSSDAARHMGRRKNANECFGCCGPNGVQWAFSAADMKWYFDWLFVRGVNLVYPHAFFYSIDGPGRIGERPPDVGPNNIWWKHYKQFSDYVKRICYIMTDSYNVTSVAVLCEEDFLPWQIVKPLYENQTEFNYLEDNLLLDGSCKIEQGNILIQKQSYSTLIVENIDMLNDKLCVVLGDFVKTGGKVILYNPENKEVPIAHILNIKSFNEINGVLGRIINRDIAAEPESKMLRTSHIIKDGQHFYYMVNEGDEEISTDVYLNISGMVEKLEPWTGKIQKVPVKEIKEKGVVIPVRLGFRESIIVCVDEANSPEIAQQVERALINEYSLNDKQLWKIGQLPYETDGFDIFDSWTEHNKLSRYSGTISYYTFFNTQSFDKADSISIDFGELHEIAELYINGILVGVRMWAPYRFDITDFIKDGENNVEVKVTNTLANKIEDAKIKSGLFGPVRIITTN